MPIKFRCAFCNQLMGIARRKAGTIAKCPTCLGQVVVPNPAADEDVRKKTAPRQIMEFHCPQCQVLLRTGTTGVFRCPRCSGVFRVDPVPPGAGSVPSHPPPGLFSEPFLGIDFGTCNSSAAWFNPRTGQAETLLNAEGEDKTPSVVYFGSRETVVGKHAEERLEHPEDLKRVITAAKRDLAKNRIWLLDGRQITPVDVAAEILKKLKRDAEHTHFHAQVMRAVITFPAVFDEIEKDRVREAARKAGFQEVELLEEPVAAAIAFIQAGLHVGNHVLVYDLGGGTFDLALLVREDGNQSFRLALEPRGERIGGEDFDRVIYDSIETKVRKMLGQPICPDGYDLHLLRQCRRYKEKLSISVQPAPLNWWWSGKGRLEVKLSRPTFESLIAQYIERTVQLTQSLRNDARAAGWTVDSVILIGGSSRIPLISHQLRQTLQLQPQEWQKRDLAVSLGAAYHAYLRWGKKSSVAQPPVSAAPPDAEFSDDAKDRLVLAQKYFAAADEMEQDPNWAKAFCLKGKLIEERGVCQEVVIDDEDLDEDEEDEDFDDEDFGEEDEEDEDDEDFDVDEDDED